MGVGHFGAAGARRLTDKQDAGDGGEGLGLGAFGDGRNRSCSGRRFFTSLETL